MFEWALNTALISLKRIFKKAIDCARAFVQINDEEFSAFHKHFPICR